MGIGFGTLLSAGAEDGFFGDEMNIASKLGEDLASRDDIFLVRQLTLLSYQRINMPLSSCVARWCRINLLPIKVTPPRLLPFYADILATNLK